MNNIPVALFLLSTGFLFTSCAKEILNTQQPPTSFNKLPAARAGMDQYISLPLDSVGVDGSSSIDIDGKIISYIWTKISGPNSFLISNPLSAITSIDQLINGSYLFELHVRDDGGLSGRDSVRINVSSAPIIYASCNMSLVPVGNLSIPRIQVAMGAAGNKILFAGGIAATIGAAPALTRVDIYDKVTNTWSIAELSQARNQMAVTVAGNKIFFAGGITNTGTLSSRVDIYDAASDKWSIAELSIARYLIAGASVGNKVFFAGGSSNQVSDVVDIYDVSTNTWSTNFLSSPRAGLTATTLHNKIYFAGGGDFLNPLSKNVIVYNGSSGSWSSMNMLEDKIEVISISLGNTVMWAGGYADSQNGFEDSRKVELYDVNDGTHTYHDFTNYGAVVYYQAVTSKNKILFLMAAMGTKYLSDIEMYNINTKSWSACTQYLPEARIFSSGDNLYMAGGFDGNGGISSQVWQLNF